MTESATGDQLSKPEPFAELAFANVVHADPARAVAQQSPAEELDNHAGVRHAGALFAVGYAASRALIGAALGSQRGSVQARMVDSEIAYEKIVSAEPITATAEPSGDWEPLLERAASGDQVTLRTAVTLRDDSGRTVTTMAVSWEAGRREVDGQ